MVFTQPLTKNKFEYLELPTQELSIQINPSENFSVDHALIHVAQTVAQTLKHTYSAQVECCNYTQTISIRAIEPEYKHLVCTEPLTARELEVVQLIANGDKNFIIAQKLHITVATVKTHVRNILKKLCVNDRTQAAIRALRSGLAH
ncbi:response regulator transcription factor [Leptolyngbya sp. GB1-A1]|uniref:response regulator transcription factor n=1 Tax=unclassified Leptolyngbya TaxID=2650499 RepID=UPI0019A841D9|nr:response regulator transcription factor [Cyanobacteria bacterium FACHB-502]